MIELEEQTGQKYGYLGIDARKENTVGVQKIEVCGYPCGRKHYTMEHAFGAMKVKNSFLNYGIETDRGQSGSPIMKRKGND